MISEFTFETVHGPITVRRHSTHERRAAFIFGHGAGAGQLHPFISAAAAAFTAAGIETITFDFPYMEAGRKVPDRAAVLEETFGAIVNGSCERWLNGEVPYFAGGKSMGGRIASQAAARDLFARPAAGLVFFGYPLHPPGQAEKRRDKHLPEVKCPMLFLHGAHDPFGTPDEMRALTKSLRRSTLELIEHGGHSFEARKRDGGSRAPEAFALAVAWMSARV